MKMPIPIFSVFVFTLVLCSCMAATPGSGLPVNFDTSKEITVVSREASSGTRGAFDELMGILVETDGGVRDILFEEAIIVDSSDAVASKIEVDKFAVGYTSLRSTSPAVKTVSIDGVAAASANIKSGSYKLSRPFILAVKSEAAGLAADFIRYATSAQGQQTAIDKGYVESVDGAPEYTASGLTGKLVLGGSTSVDKLIEKLKQDYLALNPGIDIEVQYTGSGAGIKDCSAGKIDVAMSSRALTDTEKAGLDSYIFAIDAIAIIVNPANSVSQLTSDNVHDIFTGGIRTWRELD